MKRIENTNELLLLLSQTDVHLPVFILLRGGKHKISMIDESIDGIVEINTCEKSEDTINHQFVIRTTKELLADLINVDDKTANITVWDCDGDRYKLTAIKQINDEVHLVAEDFNYLQLFSL